MNTLFHVFYAGRIYAEGLNPEELLAKRLEFPDGAYLYRGDGVWFHDHNGMNWVAEQDVPAEVRTLLLLLS